MLRISALVCGLSIGCGGGSPPPAQPAAVTAPAHVPPATPAAGTPTEAPDPAYQEALRCLEDCETNTEGDYDTVEARCREQCDLPPLE